jgi:hypothetical protein
MKKLLGILVLSLLFGGSSYANNNEKITIKEIQDLLKIPLEAALDYERADYSNKNGIWKKEIKNLKKKLAEPSFKKRVKNRGIAYCLYSNKFANNYKLDLDIDQKCKAKVIRAVVSYPEKSKLRRPGDIFYTLDIITSYLSSISLNGLDIFNEWHRIYNDNEIYPGMLCHGEKYIDKRNYSDKKGQEFIYCVSFKKSIHKKIEKFKKDPANEKLLGKKLKKYIKYQRSLKNIHENIGTENYALLGDMLNASVKDVVKDNVNPDLRIRRVLLKKYNLLLTKIKKNIEKENFKYLSKDILKLSKTYKKLSLLNKNNNEPKIDEAINIFHDTHKIIENNALKSKESNQLKNLTISSIIFTQHVVNSILDLIPDKYTVVNKLFDKDMFTETDLEKLETSINLISRNNILKKSKEFNSSIKVLEMYTNINDTLLNLEKLGIENLTNENIDIIKAVNMANNELRDSLDDEIFKSARKLLNKIDENELSELSNEAINIASEVTSDSTIKSSISGSDSPLDRTFGGQVTLKQLIAIGRVNP